MHTDALKAPCWHRSLQACCVASPCFHAASVHTRHARWMAQ